MWNSKPKQWDCPCRKRRAGNPKLVVGICFGRGYGEAVKARIAAKRLERAWLDAARAGLQDDFDG